MPDDAKTIRDFADHRASAPPSHDPRRDAFSFCGVSSIGGSAGELASIRSEHLFALSTLLDCGFADSRSLVENDEESMVATANPEILSSAREALLYMQAEALFYQRHAHLDQLRICLGV